VGSWKAYLEARHLQILASDIGEAVFVRSETAHLPDLRQPSVLSGRHAAVPAEVQARSKLLIPVLPGTQNGEQEEDAAREGDLALAA
jgi:hypothetical protein